MLLSTLNIAKSDVRRRRVSYREWLERGETLSTNSVTIPTAGAVSTIGTGSDAPVFSEDKRELVFYILAGTVVETFTINVQVTTSLGQTLNDTITANVVSP